MINFKRLYTLLFAIVMCTVSLFAQQRNLQISGLVYDKESEEGVAQATIQLLSLPDSVMEKGTTTDLEGKFLLKGGITPKPYLLKVSFIGYKPIELKIDPKKAKDGKIDLGTIQMESDAILLKEAVVTAEAPQVTVSADTISFNASAYRVPQNAMLEELVKKLPGAQVDADGKITINGKEISKIMVDGKEFFAQDPNIAMKNLPVDMIERVRSYDKKSDEARITGIDDGEEETVLDLSVKKGMNQGWVGNIDAAMGNHDRYSVKGMLNRFSDGDQYTGIFNFNNVRDASVGGGRRWSRQNGMEENKSGGFNFGLERKKWTFGGNVNFSDTETDREAKTNSETFLEIGSSYSDGISTSINRNKNFNSDFRIEWRPDSMTTLLFLPNINIGNSRSYSNGESKTAEADDFENWDKMVADDLAVNTQVDNSFSKGNSFSTGGFMMFNRKLNARGRNIGFNVNYNVGNNDSDGNSYSLIQYFKNTNPTNPGGAITNNERDLRTDNDNNNNNIRVRVNYSEPVAKNRFLQFTYGYQSSYTKTDRRTYNLLGWDPESGESLDGYLDSDLSKLAKNYYDNHEFNVKFNTIKEKYNYNIGFAVQPQKNRMKYQQSGHDIDTVRTVVNFTPVFDFRYQFNKQSQLRLRYRGRTSQPSMTNLLPIKDVTNPLNIREGNPGLKPSFTNMFMLFYNGYFQKTQRSVMANVFFQNMMNSVSSKVTYDPTTGGRVSRPENINGNWNIRSYAGFNTPFKNKKFTVSNYANFSYNNIVGYMAMGKEEAKKNKTRDLRAGNSLTFNYRDDWFEAGINGNFSYSKVKNTLQPQSNRETYDYSAGFNTNIELPWDLSLSSDVSYAIRRGYSEGLDKNEVIWNAQIAKSFLKKKQATISFQIFDILHQRSNLSRSISASMRTDTEYNEISNFFMVHFIYKLNTFGGKGAPGNNSSRGRGGYGPGPRRGPGR